MDCEGTPTEKMMLMLNEKIDALQDRVNEFSFVNSERNAIPWAPALSPESTFHHEKPNNIQEWTRKGWDVWEMLFPGNEPYYEIKTRDTRDIRLGNAWFAASSTLLTE